MIQFLNNILIALSSENAGLVNLMLIPAGFLENYLFMSLYLTIFNLNADKSQKFTYVVGVSLVGLISSYFIPLPFNVVINYFCILLLIKLIFKMNILKSFIALILPLFIMGLLSTLLQNPYLTMFNLTWDGFINIPIFRLLYLLILYSLLYLILTFLNKFRRISISLTIFDHLDKKTLKILYLNLFIGFLTLCLQLITTVYYIDIVPIIISIANFILLLFFLTLSIYSFTRIIKLADARRDLASAEEYNKSLQNLYDEVKGFKHDFNNIVSTIDGYIENGDIDGLKNYFIGVKRDCKITNNLSLLNPSTINNPGIYSLLNNKYFKAINLGITFEIEFFLNLDSLDVNMYTFSRILGVLIDNAIEEAEKCDRKFVKITFLRENNNNRALISIENTYSNKDVDVEKIFQKGESGKENHSGIGLWEVRKYVSKSKNLDLFTSKSPEFFKQELSIYDII